MTLVAQHANAEKSRTVRQMTYRGVCMIRDNGGHHGSLPPFWANRGERYARQAHCTDPAAVRDIYERVAEGESLSSIGRSHVNPRSGKTLYPNSVTLLVRQNKGGRPVAKPSSWISGILDCPGCETRWFAVRES